MPASSDRSDPTPESGPRALPDSLRRIRSLHQRSVRRRRGQALVEGPQAVRELLRFHPREVRSVHLTDAAARRHPDVARLAASVLPPDLLHPGLDEDAALAISPDAQGVLAVLRTDRGPAAHTLDRLDPSGLGLVAVLAEAADPGNAGTIVRAADAAGADAVFLAGTSVEHTNPKVLRATAGSFFHLPVVPDVDLAEAVARLRAAGLQVLAADVRGEHDLDELADRAARGGPPPGSAGDTLVDLRRPTAWVFGNEAHGLTPAQLALADAGVRVPIHGSAESLNVAIAAALCLYASARAHRVPSTREVTR